MSGRTDNYLAVLEATYRSVADEGTWLDGIVEAASPVVGAGWGAVACTVHFRRGERHPMRTLRSNGVPEGLLANWLSAVGAGRTEDRVRTPPYDARRRRVFFVPAPRATTLRRIAAAEPDDPAVIAQFRVIGDALGIRGTSLDGRSGVLLAAPSRLSIRLTGRRQRVLDRVGCHLATAHRLRTKLAGGDPFSVASAVLSSRGRVLHVAEGGNHRARSGEAGTGCGGDSSFENLGVRVLSARSLGRRGNQESALEIWRGLLAGRWSAVDHQDRDGKRFLLAIANPPGEAAPSSMTGHERHVLARVAARHPLKVVGYELGLAVSTVSEHLRSALRKLRLNSIAEAIRLFGQ